MNCGQKSNIRCFVAKSVMSRVTRAMRGGSQKVTNDDKGVTIPPKNDDVIYEQPPKKRFLTAFPYRREKPGKKVFLAAICAVIAASATME